MLRYFIAVFILIGFIPLTSAKADTITCQGLSGNNFTIDSSQVAEYCRTPFQETLNKCESQYVGSGNYDLNPGSQDCVEFQNFFRDRFSLGGIQVGVCPVDFSSSSCCIVPGSFSTFPAISNSCTVNEDEAPITNDSDDIYRCDSGVRTTRQDLENDGCSRVGNTVRSCGDDLMTCRRELEDGSVNPTDILCCNDSTAGRNTSSFVGCINEPEEDKAACEACVGSVNSPTGKIWTEIGCLDPSPAGIITRMFQIAFGILGGVGILRLMQIGVLYQSQDQEKIKEAKDMTFSLFAGIILMIMGIVILKFLGVNVLGLPDNFLGV